MTYIGNNLTVQQYSPQIAYFSGNGTATSFTLPSAVVSAAQIIVVVANVIQNPSSAYTVSGTTLTFTSAPPSGTNNIWVEYTSLQTNTIAPSAGTVGQTQINSSYSLWNLSSGNINYTAGNVGVGTSSPGYTLDVYGNFRCSGSTNGSVIVDGAAAGNPYVGLAQSNSLKAYMQLLGTSSHQLIFNIDSSQTVAMTSSGLFLYCTSGTSVGSQTGASNVSTFNQAGITLTQYGVSTGFYYDRLNFTNSQYFVVNSSGTGVYLGNGSTSWTAYSDSRLKNVTGTYTNALNDIAQLQPVKFTWKSDKENKPCVGVIAQSVQPVVPEAVDTSKLPGGSGDETEYLAVRYTELIPLMIASIQELKTTVETQAAEIAALKAKVGV